MSALTRTDQKLLSLALSSLWKLMPGLAGLSCRSNTVVLTDFCSSPVKRRGQVSRQRRGILLTTDKRRISVSADTQHNGAIGTSLADARLLPWPAVERIRDVCRRSDWTAAGGVRPWVWVVDLVCGGPGGPHRGLAPQASGGVLRVPGPFCCFLLS